MFRALRTLLTPLRALSLAAAMSVASPAAAQQGGGYTIEEIVDQGHSFFGATAGGLASMVEHAFQRFGLPNGYILGEEGGGAFIGGVRYGEGTLFTKNAGEHRVYWQGPSLGFDAGADGARMMALIYNLPAVQSVYGRFGGVSGNAYLVGGLGMTVLQRDTVTMVPIKTGVGARLGVNLGYLKITPTPTWNPF